MFGVKYIIIYDSFCNEYKILTVVVSNHSLFYRICRDTNLFYLHLCILFFPLLILR